jgi:8-oxo-dGTP pyrophosphatase MutT (NUDIX family)
MTRTAPVGDSGMRERLRQRLRGTLPSGDEGARVAGLPVPVGRELRDLLPPVLTSAAVLIPVIDRATGLSVLFTERASTLRHHGGQISFPGGRLDPGESSPVDAALREAEEEVGLARSTVEVLGRLPDHLIFTGYRVTPVVGLVQPAEQYVPESSEVASVFEVPFEYLLDLGNYRNRSRTLGGREVEVYEIPYLGHTIWGATAGMVRNLYEVLTDGATGDR